MEYKYVVIILVHNLNYFNIMLRNMPKQSDKILFCICNDERYICCENGIKDLIKQYSYKANFKFLSAKRVNDFLKSELNLTSIGLEFIDKYTMGMNINPEFYLYKKYRFEKMFICDDDILIFKNLIDIFECKESEENMYCKLFFGSLANKGDKRIVEEWARIGNTNVEDICKHNVIGGNKLINTKFMNLYGKCLEDFYNSKFFLTIWSGWTNKLKRNYNAFELDQNFDNAFACAIKQNDKLHDTLQPYIKIIWSIKSLPKDKNKLKDCFVLHYACGKNKDLFLNMLIDDGIIMGG